MIFRISDNFVCVWMVRRKLIPNVIGHTPTFPTTILLVYLPHANCMIYNHSPSEIYFGPVWFDSWPGIAYGFIQLEYVVIVNSLIYRDKEVGSNEKNIIKKIIVDNHLRAHLFTKNSACSPVIRKYLIIIELLRILTSLLFFFEFDICL